MITKKEILLKPALQNECAVKEIGLFGSFSDEMFNETSDIGILFELAHHIND